MALLNQTVSELLIDIERGRIALPDMQREFIWENTQIRDVIDSLYKNHPIGMILLWQTNLDDNIPITAIDDTTKEISNYTELVIDGQQRLTSLLLAKKGVIFKGAKERTIKLLFNPFEEKFEIEIPPLKNKPDWFDITRVIKDGEYSVVNREELKLIGWNEEKIYKCLQKLAEVRNIFVGARNSIPVFTISSDMDYEEVADIFVKINSKGTRIRITELLLALLALKIPGEFRKDFRNYIEKLEDTDWYIDAGVVIRSLVAISVKQGRLAYFRNIARSISDEDLRNNWNITKKSLEECFKILEENLGINNSYIFPSQYVLIPLAFYISQKKDAFSEKDSKEFILWFLLASYWGRYAGSPETKLDEDIKSITENKNLSQLFHLLKSQVGRLLIDEERFAGKSKNSKLLLYVVARSKGAEDWWKGHKITTSDYEEHHIIPRSLLKNADYEYSLIDDTSNIAFLTEKANRTISNTPPEIYLEKIDPAKLEKQFVPLHKKLWIIENYESFLEQRRKIIVEQVNAYFKSLGVEGYL
ncbi:MAG: DUF262 domain-containing protein [bacterium]